jgi:predicted DNA-binding protein
MRKDKLISFRVPEPVYEGLRSLADRMGITVSRLMKDSVSSASWRVELERNRIYHSEVLNELDRIEKRMSRSEKQRAKTMKHA